MPVLAVVGQLTHSVYLPSILKVLGLMSWQGVVTVIMLSGSLPCNSNDSLTLMPDTLYAHSCDV